MRLLVPTPWRVRIPWGRWLAVAVQAGIMLAFWLALSGRVRLPYLAFGVVAVAIVLLLNREVFSLRGPVGRPTTLRKALTIAGRWIGYGGWLLYSIALANVQVAYVVLHPRMPLRPALLRFRVPRLRETAQVVLANSITLTPGTVTADLQDGQFTVHTLMPSLAGALVAGEMPRRVAALFGDSVEGATEVTWASSLKNLHP
ncbi:MAG: Na+/H+ antiporter subunit E [Dehalococcoidia bacterium]|nr:Na+/H+ antiporter subunit E [Dehalococcoidia bacterium]MDW8119788.1 Na+/H+ antiporter subunit E [Chloroflexota bacterium]